MEPCPLSFAHCFNISFDNRTGKCIKDQQKRSTRLNHADTVIFSSPLEVSHDRPRHLNWQRWQASLTVKPAVQLDSVRFARCSRNSHQHVEQPHRLWLNALG
jgi:stress response protein SCP2